MQVSAISDRPADSVGPQQDSSHNLKTSVRVLDAPMDNETPAVVAKIEIPKSPRKYSECSKTPIVNPVCSVP